MIGLGGSAVMSENEISFEISTWINQKKVYQNKTLLLNDLLNCYQKIYTEMSKMRNGT